MPGLYDLVDSLKSAGYRIAIASSSILDHIKMVLQGLKLEDKFDVVVSGDQVKHSKPNPEIYLTAATALGVKPEESLALEDASSGVQAAKNAGMMCIAVPNEYTRDGDFSRADLIVSGLGDISVNTVKTLSR